MSDDRPMEFDEADPDPLTDPQTDPQVDPPEDPDGFGEESAPPLPAADPAPRALPPPPRGADGRHTLTDEDRLMVIGAHLGPLFAGFLAPLVIWLIVKDKGPEKQFVIDNAKEALNFQITVMIALVASLGLTIVTMFFCFFPLGGLVTATIVIGSLILEIMATLAAADGKWHSYPFTLRLVR